MDTLLQDLRYALRSLAKTPGFAAVAVLTLALGIGANTAIFTVVNGVLLRALPYPGANLLVRVYENDVNEGRERGSLSPADFLDYKARQRTLAGLAAFTSGDFQYAGEGGPERLLASRVSASFFDLIGVAPVLGRTFAPEADAPGAERVVVLSRGLWQRLLGGDPAAVGRTILLNNAPHRVIGVMPAGFVPPSGPAELWAPIDLEPVLRDPAGARKFHFLNVLGRLKPEATLAAARADLLEVARSLEREYADVNTGHLAAVVPLQEAIVGPLKPALLTLMGAVGFVLLIACANVANIALARAVARQRELAVRAALGARRARLVRQILTESLLVALAGGGLGLLLATWGVDALLAIAPMSLPLAERVTIDAPVLAFTFLVSVATGVVFGLLPAWTASGDDLIHALKDGERSSGGPGPRRLRSLVVAGQAALAVLLLVGAGLCLRTLVFLQRVPLGFEPEGVLAFAASLPESRYANPESRVAFYEALIDRLKAIPGVRDAATVGNPPLLSAATASLVIEGRPTASGPPPEIGYNTVSEGYFRTLGVPLLAGRGIERHDRAGAPPVVVVNQKAARRFWPGRSPIGAHVRLGPDPSEPWAEVVGVVGDLRQNSVAADAGPAAYVPMAQNTWDVVSFMVRSTTDAKGLEHSVREAARAVDPAQPLHDFRPMVAVVADDLAGPRFSMLLLGLFAGVALVLSALGIYGVVAYAASQRAREFGVRLALGAQRRDLLGLVVQQGLGSAGLGIVLGLVGALALTRLLSGLLYGVSPVDPVTFVAAAALLLATALVASYLPARRAAGMDPIAALRCE